MAVSDDRSSDPALSLVDSLGALARTFELPQDEDALLADVTQGLGELLDLSATAAVLAPAVGPSVVRVHPAGYEELGRWLTPPMVDAVLAPSLTGTAVRVPDLSAGHSHDAGLGHWGDRPVSADAGPIHALAGVPVRQGRTTVGALYLFSAYAREWPATTMTLAQTFADLTGTYLALLQAVEERAVVAGQLQTALDSRILIEQAKGVLAASLDISVDDGFNRIRGHARRHRVTISEVAEAVVRSGLRP